MIVSLVVIALAFTWLLYESDWMRVRLPIGKSIKTIKLWQYRENGQYGITHIDPSPTLNGYRWPPGKTQYQLFSVGITEPICGWDWILNHEHPIITNRIEITAHNCKHTVTLCDNPDVDYGRIMKEACSIAFKANIRPKNGRKPKRSKGLTFNPNYGIH